MHLPGFKILALVASLLFTEARVIPIPSKTRSTHNRSQSTISYRPPVSTPHPADLDVTPTPNVTASSNSSSNFLGSLFSAQYNHYYKDTTHSVWNDFWMEAISWEVSMDMYGVNKTLRPLIDDVYNGFMALHPDMDGVCNAPANTTLTLPTIQNPCNDDVMWWARASARAYEITGNQRYLLCSQRLFDHVFQSWDTTILGGGIFWGCTEAARMQQPIRDNTVLSSHQKNVATNAPSAITAVKLSRALNNTGYLAKAVEIYQWLESALANNETGVVNDSYDQGQLHTWQFTYNYGTIVGAAVALYSATLDPSYLTRASLYANTSFTRLSQPNTTILQYEGTGDGGGFAGIYLRHINELALLANATTPMAGNPFKDFIVANAKTVWQNRRLSDGLMGGNWLQPAPNGTLEAHMVGSAVTAILMAGL